MLALLFYFLPPSFTCIIIRVICWHKGSAKYLKAGPRLHYCLSLHRRMNKIKELFHSFVLDMHALSRQAGGAFKVTTRSRCGFIRDIEENLFCCVFSPRILRGDDRCWHFTFRRCLLERTKRRSAPHFLQFHSCSKYSKKQPNNNGCDSLLVQNQFYNWSVCDFSLPKIKLKKKKAIKWRL